MEDVMTRFLWVQKQDIGPKPRVGHAMAYDASRSRVVLFGGYSSGPELFNDTWEWDGENWTQVSDIGPTPRGRHAIVYDGARQRVVLFGGSDNSSDLGDTWEWDGQDWIQLADTGPSARSGHAMAFDSNRNRTVLFAGNGGGVSSETWEWDGEEWMQVEDTGPSPRWDHAMTYDAIRKRVILFGGTQNAGVHLTDTWAWDGSVWTEVADIGPAASANTTLVFESSLSVLFGGSAFLPDGSGTVLGDSWSWDGKHWTKRQDIGPGPRRGHAMAYDSTRSRLVLFGGLPDFTANRNRLLGDTWEHADDEAASPPLVEFVQIASLDLVPTVYGGARWGLE
jgi:hypothetical protein